MTTVEKNIAIAEILGWKHPTEEGRWVLPISVTKHSNHSEWAESQNFDGWNKYIVSDGNLQFHSDANWQFEAIEYLFSDKILDGSRPFVFGKLDSLKFDILSDKVKVRASYWNNPNTLDGNFWIYFKKDFSYKKYKRIEAVFEALYQFSQYLKNILK